jgi:hypothetical protein
MHLTYMCAPHFYHAILSQPVVTLRLFNAQFLLSKYVTYFFLQVRVPFPCFLLSHYLVNIVLFFLTRIPFFFFGRLDQRSSLFCIFFLFSLM